MSADYKMLFFDGRQLSFNHLISFVDELLDSAEAILATKLLFDVDKSIPEFNLQVIDDPSNHNAGHYFLFDEPDGTRNGCQRMMDRLQHSDYWAKMTQVNGDCLKFHQSAVDEYMKDDTIFRELLALLVMFTCGISGRGTEMTSLRYMNAMDGDRMIYVEDGQFMIITEYHKSMALMDDLKVGCR
jgi:hypothetical protein